MGQPHKRGAAFLVTPFHAGRTGMTHICTQPRLDVMEIADCKSNDNIILE